MRILSHTQPDFGQAIRSLNRRAAPTEQVESTVAEIIAAVRERGDAAVLELSERFTGAKLSPQTLRVTEGEFTEGEVPAEVREAIALSHANVRQFAEASLRRDWKMTNAQGAEVGERFLPFQRVGIYVPGGSAPLVSTAIMTVTLAATAGVPEIVVTTPSDREGRVNSALLHALRVAGATEVYKLGGAQAIAAMAYGTATVAPVSKIFGPGNAYVVEAKRQCFGVVAIDLLPGPSEILVLADHSGDARAIAADLLAQAEHDPVSLIGLVTDSMDLLDRVRAEMERQKSTLRRREIIEQVLREGCFLVHVAKFADGVSLANAWAPEHLLLVSADEESWLPAITTAGAIFLGNLSPVAAGDFLAGPSHTLPTGGAGKSFPGLTVDQFQRRTSIVKLDRAALERSVPVISTFCEVEGLDAHARSATIRLD